MSKLFVNTIAPNSGDTVTLSGSLVTTGKLTIGDADTDTVAFSAEISSSLLPDADNAYDLGSSTKEWKDLYVDGTAYIDSIDAGVVIGVGANIPSISSSIDVSGSILPNFNSVLDTGPSFALGSSVKRWKDLYIDRIYSCSIANIYTIGNDDEANRIFVSGGLIPTTGATYALGTMANSWGSAHIHGLAHIHTASIGIVSSSLLPDATATYNLGTMAKAWAEAHIHGLAHIHTASIGVVSSSLVPTADDTFNLGSPSLQWNDLYVDGVANIDTLEGVSTATITTANIGNIPTLNSPEINSSSSIKLLSATTASLHVSGAAGATDIIFKNLPTSQPTVTGSLWLSGSTTTGNSALLAVFTG